MTVSADPLTLAIDGSGRLPALHGPAGARPLVAAVNAWQRGKLGGVLEGLRGGAAVADAGHYARRPYGPEEVRAHAVAWGALAGAPAGEDVFLVGAAPGDELLVPRSTLIAACEGLAAAVEADLEPQAQETDELTITAQTDQEALRAHARRRHLLDALAEAGVLRKGATAWVRTERLRGYAAAAERLGAYATSDARTQTPGLPAAPVVSLDWFRLQTPTPPGHDPFAWLASWEAAFIAGGAYEGAEGARLWRRDEGWYRLEWRRDDGEVALLLRVAPQTA